MLAVRESNQLTSEDIPDKGFFIGAATDDHEKKISEEVLPKLKEELKYLLKEVNSFNNKNELVGREKLAKIFEGTGYEMTPYQVRNRLEELERIGLVIKKRGKHGTIVTEKGKKTLMVLFGDN